MYLWDQIELEDKLREEAFLAEIGPMGRVVDNPATYILSLFLIMPFCFCIGLLIGSLL